MIKDEYRTETNKDVYAESNGKRGLEEHSTGDYSNDYVKWLETKLKNNEVLDPVMLCYVDTYSANGYPTFKKGKFYPIEKSYLKGLLIMRNEQGINTKMSGEYWETIKDNFNKA